MLSRVEHNTASPRGAHRGAAGPSHSQILEKGGGTVDAGWTLMRRLTRLGWPAMVSVLLGACATSGTGGDVIRPRSNLTAADYYPLADGWKWAFDVEQGGMNILATYVVLERQDTVAIVQAGNERLTYVVTPDGVAQYEGHAIGDYVIKN